MAAQSAPQTAVRFEYEPDDDTAEVARVTRAMIESETDLVVLARWNAGMSQLADDIAAKLKAYALSGMRDEGWALRARDAFSYAEMGAKRSYRRLLKLRGETDELDKLRKTNASLRASLDKSKFDSATARAAREVLPDHQLALVTKRAAEILEERIGEGAP